MPAIGEQLTFVPETPRITPEQRANIASREIEIGKRIAAMAPPMDGYMLWPLYYAPDLTVTISGCATYAAGNTTVAAFVTRDINNDVQLQTILYPEPPGQITAGPGVELSNNEYNRGKLTYVHGRYSSDGFSTYEQYTDALANIDETLDLIAGANNETFGVSDFSGLSPDELVAARRRAEPGMHTFIARSHQESMVWYET